MFQYLEEIVSALLKVFVRGTDMGRKIMIGIIAASILSLFVMIVIYHLRPDIIKSNNGSLCVEYNLVFGKEGVGPREAELYLAVQHSAYPGIKVLWPVNVGPNSVPSGFRAIPFTAEQGDKLKFSLLDDDDITSKEEKVIRDAAGAAGSIIVELSNVYYVLQTGKILPRGTADIAKALLQLGATEVIRTSHEHPWDDYGSADYIVQQTIPDSPSAANPVTIASNWGLLRRLDIKVYRSELREK